MRLRVFGVGVKKRRFAGAVPAIAGIVAVVAGLAVIDKDIHTQLLKLLHGDAMTEMTSMSVRVQDSAVAAFRIVRDQGMEHGPLTAFTVAAAVLLLLMLKT